MRQVTGDLNIGKADKADLGVLDFLLDQLGEIAPDLTSYTFGSVKFPGRHIASIQCPGDLDTLEAFDLITRLDIVIHFDANTALRSGLHFAGVILEASQ